MIKKHFRKFLATLIACAKEGLDIKRIFFQTKWAVRTGPRLALDEGFYDILDAFHDLEEETLNKA